MNHAGLKIYEVDEIVGERGEGDEKEYLTFWKPRKKYDTATWTAAGNLSGCQWAVTAFYKKRARQRARLQARDSARNRGGRGRRGRKRGRGRG